jgi:hypothetical protein
MNALKPPPGNHWPEQHCSGNDEKSKTPGSMGGMGIDFSNAEKREGNGKGQTANQVNAA